MFVSGTRREFLRDLGVGAATLPFVWNLPTLGFANQLKRKQRLLIMFTPNGVHAPAFWCDEEGELATFKECLEPLEPFKKRTLLLHGVHNQVQCNCEAHQRGIGSLLTGITLAPGNVAFNVGNMHYKDGIGWAGGISIDQEIKNHLQRSRKTRTRFGSLEFGVMVPDIANTWSRMSYAGANKPLAPIDDPYQMFAKLYGRVKDQQTVKSILDDLQEDLRKVSGKVGTEDRRLLDEHATFVREMEQELQTTQGQQGGHAIPKLKSGVERGFVPLGNRGNVQDGIPKNIDQMPRISKMQLDLLVSSFAADFARVATLQFTSAISDASMPWLGIPDSHHALAHGNEPAKTIQYDKWYCGQLAYLARRLDETPEPGGEGSLLDNTLLIWTNEHGSGWHSQNDIPFVLVGNGLNFRMGRMLGCGGVPHNRVWLSLAHALGHEIKAFGQPEFCEEGGLSDLT